MGWIKPRSLKAIGEAVMVPGPLPTHPDEPRPLPRSALGSQPVAVIVMHGGRPLPVGFGAALAVGVVLSWARIGVETGPHAPIRITVSSRRPNRAMLDMVVTPQRVRRAILRFWVGIRQSAAAIAGSSNANSGGAQSLLQCC